LCRSDNPHDQARWHYWPPIDLSGGEKLDVLQRLDRYRKWQSLDEKRYCLACGRVINGHEIQLVGGTRGTGPLRLICSTRGCHSIPMDWVIPTDKVIARMSVFYREQATCNEQQLRDRERNCVRYYANS
jgi:hypothetical protein